MRAIHKRRHAAQFAEVVHLGAWFVGVAAAAGMAAATLIGSR